MIKDYVQNVEDIAQTVSTEVGETQAKGLMANTNEKVAQMLDNIRQDVLAMYPTITTKVPTGRALNDAETQSGNANGIPQNVNKAKRIRNNPAESKPPAPPPTRPSTRPLEYWPDPSVSASLNWGAVYDPSSTVLSNSETAFPLTGSPPPKAGIWDGYTDSPTPTLPSLARKNPKKGHEVQNFPFKIGLRNTKNQFALQLYL
ncbi:hypothetical protein B0T25DRAFT_609927 [Lasiosphaeria hispida]|uniref:Uncharacterized protein n=1 Tax=Lasiosphaeria hispida TaxID=260671 RepID=A0AAJ0HEP4_9PEZI|nr:hypothetical protein B0T25DRAFT_609927 [Lasiosphaeria hispida]